MARSTSPRWPRWVRRPSPRHRYRCSTMTNCAGRSRSVTAGGSNSAATPPSISTSANECATASRRGRTVARIRERRGHADHGGTSGHGRADDGAVHDGRANDHGRDRGDNDRRADHHGHTCGTVHHDRRRAGRRRDERLRPREWKLLPERHYRASAGLPLDGHAHPAGLTLGTRRGAPPGRPLALPPGPALRSKRGPERAGDSPDAAGLGMLVPSQTDSRCPMV